MRDSEEWRALVITLDVFAHVLEMVYMVPRHWAAGEGGGRREGGEEGRNERTNGRRSCKVFATGGGFGLYEMPGFSWRRSQARKEMPGSVMNGTVYCRLI